MRRFLQELQDFPKKGDWILLLLCLITSGFGCIAIASATNAEKFGDNNIKYIIIQLAATLLGVMMFAIISSIDVEAMSERRNWLVAFNTLLLLMLIVTGITMVVVNLRKSGHQLEKPSPFSENTLVELQQKPKLKMTELKIQ